MVGVQGAAGGHVTVAELLGESFVTVTLPDGATWICGAIDEVRKRSAIDAGDSHLRMKSVPRIAVHGC
ncbi:hypothetical protein [Streptosporangium sp. NPDC048865]|uniref:hypothetical protein n=1 Tax=Streptosporangium sp. NPDC048865 TaxID=3155766 RepID=UPI00344A1EB2